MSRSLCSMLGLGVIALGLTGCQVDVGGQTLPSPYYMSDDVQYFPAGPEFILSNEAAAMDARREAAAAGGEELPVPPPPGAAMYPRPGFTPTRG